MRAAYILFAFLLELYTLIVVTLLRLLLVLLLLLLLFSAAMVMVLVVTGGCCLPMMVDVKQRDNILLRNAAVMTIDGT